MINQEIRVPDHYAETGEHVMSNFDHVIHQDVAEQLKSGEYKSSYPGWEFHGYVWWLRDRQEWACQVKRYRVFQGTYIAPTLEQLMQDICADYGDA